MPIWHILHYLEHKRLISHRITVGQKEYKVVRETTLTQQERLNIRTNIYKILPYHYELTYICIA